MPSTIARMNYDQEFNESELRTIRRLRSLDGARVPLSWAAGVTTTAVVFLAQVPFHGFELAHLVATYGCLPAGLFAGLGTNVKLDQFIEGQFSKKWDPLFFERSGRGPEWLAACDERNWLIEQPWFHRLSEAERSRRLKQINKK